MKQENLSPEEQDVPRKGTNDSDDFIWALAFVLMLATLIGFCIDPIIWAIRNLF